MKKVILFLFLFYVKIASAQHIYYGFEFSPMGYIYTVSYTQFNSGAFSFGICPQFVLKDSSFGFELNASAYSHGTNTGGYSQGAGYSIAPYFFFNTSRKSNIAVMLRVGMFYSKVSDSYLEPGYDIGPSVGVFLFFKIAPTFYLGPDFSMNFGQKFYSLQERGSLGGPPNPTYSSQLTTYNFSIKILFR